MITDPAIIGLMFTAITGACFLIYASGIGVRIIIGWDMKNGDERQLLLERKTCLISVILYYVMLCEFLSLFLFVFIAEDIHSLFIGAMCAAGTLNVNGFGWPGLLIKLINLVLCGIWLITNYVDNRGYDYPLIRFKYKFLLIITLLVVCETALLFSYFTRLSPEIITSCCGTLFNEDARSVAGQIVSLPMIETSTIFYLLVALTAGTGIYFCRTEKLAGVFSGLSIMVLPVGLASILSFISVYFYQQPTHHCPFCLLKKEYHHVGYILYLALFTGGVAGAGTGIIDRFKTHVSIEKVVPKIQKQLCRVSLIGYGLFVGISACPILFSDFMLR